MSSYFSVSGESSCGSDTINITGAAGVDTITLDSSPYIGAITLPSSTTVTSGGYQYSSGTSSVSYTINPSTYSTWSNAGTTGNVNIGSNGIDMKEGTDIKIDGKSLKDFMTKMEERMAILVPDPKKLEKFEALKRAYEHYKLMEKLCQEDEPKEEK